MCGNRDTGGRPGRTARDRVAGSVLLAALGVGSSVPLACGGASLRGARSAAPAPGPASDGLVRSNVSREDYAGSSACAPCHAGISEDWQRAPMHRMTRLPRDADVHAPFDGGVFRFKKDAVRLEVHAGERFARIESATLGDRVFRVTKVIGGRHREDFAGVEVAGTQPGAATLGDPRDERILPFSYMLATKAFRYKGYSVMTPERPGLRPGSVWNKTCVFCHNTIPYLSTILGALAGPGTPPYQGLVVDPLLPPARRWAFEVTDDDALRRALAAETSALGAPPPDPDSSTSKILTDAVATTRTRFDAGHILEVGIGCESCHGGSAEHVRDPRVRPTFDVRSSFLRARPPAPPRTPSAARAQAINRTCARCHQVLFTKYPWTWEGGQRSALPGGSHINSGEARDFLLGGCASEMSCASCHTPHTSHAGAPAAATSTQGTNRVCVSCHAHLATPEAQRRHSKHAPEGAAGACVACHMPRKNMSLDTRLTRYHRIGSPTDRVRVENDRPLECALCHTDKSVGALVGDMERLWGKTYDRQKLRALYGELAARPLLATVERGKAHEQAAAIFTLGEAAGPDGAPTERDARVAAIAGALTQPYPIVRYYARDALVKMLGEPGPGGGVDLDGTNEEIREAAARWLRREGGTASR